MFKQFLKRRKHTVVHQGFCKVFCKPTGVNHFVHTLCIYIYIYIYTQRRLCASSCVYFGDSLFKGGCFIFTCQQMYVITSCERRQRGKGLIVVTVGGSSACQSFTGRNISYKRAYMQSWWWWWCLISGC